jgi:hypothetical protein
LRFDIKVENFSDRWVNLNLRVQAVEDIKIIQPPDYSIAVVYDAEIKLLDKLVKLDFFPHADAFALTSQTQYENRDQSSKRQSSLRVIGKACEWWISPYKEEQEG